MCPTNNLFLPLPTGSQDHPGDVSSLTVSWELPAPRGAGGHPRGHAGHVAVTGCLAPCLGSHAERTVTPPKTGEQAGLETHHEQAMHGGSRMDTCWQGKEESRKAQAQRPQTLGGGPQPSNVISKLFLQGIRQNASAPRMSLVTSP